MSITYKTQVEYAGPEKPRVVLKSYTNQEIEAQWTDDFFTTLKAGKTVRYLHDYVMKLRCLKSGSSGLHPQAPIDEAPINEAPIDEVAIYLESELECPLALNDAIQPAVYLYRINEDELGTSLGGPYKHTITRPFEDLKEGEEPFMLDPLFEERFWFDIKLRDNSCCFTGDFVGTEVCMVLPSCLESWYVDDLISPNFVGSEYTSANGLLLRADLKVEFEQYRMSIWVDPVDEQMYIHVFGDVARHLHGRPFSHWHLSFRKSVFKWHYSQCCMARIRGKYCRFPMDKVLTNTVSLNRRRGQEKNRAEHRAALQEKTNLVQANPKVKQEFYTEYDPVDLIFSVSKATKRFRQLEKMDRLCCG